MDTKIPDNIIEIYKKKNRTTDEQIELDIWIAKCCIDEQIIIKMLNDIIEKR